MDIHMHGDGDLNLGRSGQNIAYRSLWDKSDIGLGDIDVFLPYDRYSFSGVIWLEDAGYCKRAETGAFMQQHWDDSQGRIVINGKVPVNSHGGSLAEGGAQGAGHLREAVVQLRGDAGVRQVPEARTALITSGTFLQNPNALIVRTAD
jgi:acetyl-CoA acetyltransferase